MFPSIPRTTSLLEAAEFERNYSRASQPVVLENPVPDWSALADWNVDAFAAHLGDAEVVIGLSDDAVFRENSGERASFSSFAQRLLSDMPVGKKGVVNLPMERLGSMAEQASPPPSTLHVKSPITQVWLSPCNAITTLHYDLSDVLVVQVKGTKRWSLYHPNDWRRLYPRSMFKPLGYHGRVDIDAPDLKRFPRFEAAQRFEAVVEAGQAIFVPAGWWHQVYSLGSENISVHYRWVNPASQTLRIPSLLRLTLHNAFIDLRFRYPRQIWRKLRGSRPQAASGNRSSSQTSQSR